MSYPTQIADEIAKDRPKEAWKVIAKCLEGKRANGYYVLTWFGDGGRPGDMEFGAIRHMNPGDVLAWARLRPKKRVRLILRALPKTLDSADAGTLTQMFIEEFGEDEEVAGSLMLHFRAGGWTGPESEYLAAKRDKARKWLSETVSPRIQVWLGRYIEHLSDLIEAEQIAEERER
jgi:hypothetical protein